MTVDYATLGRVAVADCSCYSFFFFFLYNFVAAVLDMLSLLEQWRLVDSY